jgi:hypothetical protein
VKTSSAKSKRRHSVIKSKSKKKAEPVESVADKYFGIFKVEKWPDDLDEFMVEAVAKWWKNESRENSPNANNPANDK